MPDSAPARCPWGNMWLNGIVFVRSPWGDTKWACGASLCSGVPTGRDVGQAQHLDGGLPHVDLADLAAGRHREVLDDPHVTRDLVVGELPLGVGPDVGRGQRPRAGMQ